MRNAFRDTLLALAKENANMMLLTADLGFGVFDTFIEKFPKQFLNVGVAEQNMIGVATGLSLSGYIVYTYSIGNFATFRCLEHIRNDACYHDANIKIVTCGGGFSYGALGMSHHATEDLGIMRTLPNISIVAPCDAWEAAQATRALFHTPGVGYLRLEKNSPPSPHHIPETSFQIGVARTLHRGQDITLIATGSIALEALSAAHELAKQNIAARVISMHTIKPIDRHAIISAATETGGIITIEEHTVEGGLGSIVAETCLENHVSVKRFARIGLRDTFSSIVGRQEFLRKQYQMDMSAIVNKTLQLVKISEGNNTIK